MSGPTNAHTLASWCIIPGVPLFAFVLASTLSATPFPIAIVGNEVLADEVYFAVLDLPDDAEPDESTARYVHDAIETFLRRSGYDLAAVAVAPADGGFKVIIDEGRLEKIVFRGRLTFQMIRLKLALDLPREIFNKPHLEQELTRLSKQLGIDIPRWELVPTAMTHHAGFQLNTLGEFNEVFGSSMLHQQMKYELHIHFRDKEWNTGSGLDIRTSYFDGFELGLSYQGRSLLFDDDRWRTSLFGGIGLRLAIKDSKLYAFPSRVYTDFQWFTPGLDEGKTVRPFVWLRSEGTARQRFDLRYENYYFLQSELSFNVNVQPTEALSLFVGYGLQHLFVGGLAPVPGEPQLPDPSDPQRIRNFFQLRADYVFADGAGRWDRRHMLMLDGRVYSNYQRPDDLNFSEVRVAWQQVLNFGWHDLWLFAKGTWLNGDVVFTFEEPLALHLRSVFGDVFVRTAASARAEFRYSLTRDLYKVGAFLDLATYGELSPMGANGRRLSNAQTLRAGAAVGPGFHMLIEGMFQMDIYLCFGVVSTGRVTTSGNVVLNKVF